MGNGGNSILRANPYNHGRRFLCLHDKSSQLLVKALCRVKASKEMFQSRSFQTMEIDHKWMSDLRVDLCLGICKNLSSWDKSIWR